MTLGNQKMEVFNEIPIKEMRANSLIELDLSAKSVGVVGGMVVAGLLIGSSCSRPPIPSLSLSMMAFIMLASLLKLVMT